MSRKVRANKRLIGVLAAFPFTSLFFLVPSTLRHAANPASPTLTTPASSVLARRAQLVESYGKLPLSFEPNQGQADPRVRYISRGDGYTLFLTPGEALLSLRRDPAAPARGVNGDSGISLAGTPNFANLQREASLSRQALLLAAPYSFEPPASSTPYPAIESITLKLEGGNPTARVAGLNPLPGKSNYLLGKDPAKWHTGIPNYARVQYENIYPGVNLVYYGNQHQLEYDFVISPGADPSAIRLKVEAGNRKLENGNSKLELAANGDLVIYKGEEKVRFRKPVVYQPRHAKLASTNSEFTIQNSELREGHYVLLADNRVGFAVGHYDRSRPLVIDPVLAYSTYLGGVGLDVCSSIAVDSTGSAYITGFTETADFPTANPIQAHNASTNADVFVTKLNSTGTALVYSTYLGGTGDDEGNGIAVDSAGNAYVAGFTTSTNFPTASPLRAANAGSQDAFVAKLNATGSALVYSTYLGGSGDDRANAIAVDTAGNAYVAGQTQSLDFPSASAVQASNAGLTDAFVMKLNAAGSALVYSTYLGGADQDSALGIAVDTAGNAYVSGETQSSNFPTVTPLQAANGGAADAFVAKLNATGNALVYSTYLGGSGDDEGNGIAVDSSGNAYVTGGTSSSNFRTAGPFQAALRGTRNAFVSKVDAGGTALAYSTFLGGSGSDQGNAIAVDSSGSAYVVGNTGSTDFPTAHAIQAANAGPDDVFVANLSAAGNVLTYSTYLGGSDEDQSRGIAVDSSGNAYVAGFTFSANFPTAHPIQTGHGGEPDGDVFVAKIAGSAGNGGPAAKRHIKTSLAIR